MTGPCHLPFLSEKPDTPEPTCLLSRHPLRSSGWNGVQRPPARARPGQEEGADRDKWHRLCLSPLHAEARTADADRYLRDSASPL